MFPLAGGAVGRANLINWSLIFPCIQNILTWPYILNILAVHKVQFLSFSSKKMLCQVPARTAWSSIGRFIL